MTRALSNCSRAVVGSAVNPNVRDRLAADAADGADATATAT
jgi:hypothetical protein